MVSFAGVASFTGGGQIVPGGFPAPTFRHHMVQRQIIVGSAILAPVAVPLEEVLPGHDYAPVWYVYVTMEAYHDGHGKPVVDSPEMLLLRLCEHFRFFHINQQKCLRNCANT